LNSLLTPLTFLTSLNPLFIPVTVFRANTALTS
jgi:hypothetical protein